LVKTLVQLAQDRNDEDLTYEQQIKVDLRIFDHDVNESSSEIVADPHQ
jgi:hypothetical protein